MQGEVFRFSQSIRRINKMSDSSDINRQLDSIELKVGESIALANLRRESLPVIKYPDLPVSEHKDEIGRAIASNQVVIIAGETGSGKTTQIPKICLELGRGVKGIIGHTQPRRLAARTVANRIAEELDTQLGEKVGFKIRFSDQASDQTLIKLMTDGILLAEIQSDRFLSQYDTIIIDEAHERSLNIDFILGYFKQLLPKRPDLKLIITSATIDPERFSKHFNDAPIIQVSGRTYPVEMRYRPIEDHDDDIDQVQGIIRAAEELGRESQGDILVFLSGERDIRDTAEALKKRDFRATEILPLYARLSSVEQNKIFQPHGLRRIVLATNVAETSLTVPGIKYVIDPGTARISRYSYRTKVQRLPIEPISQASANQRAGRCGRVSEGICIRLYSEDDFNNRAEFTDPEILRTNLASVILQMLSLGLGSIGEFPFVQPPDNRFINDGFRLLEELEATHKQNGNVALTAIGRQIARLPVDPRYARMVIESGKLGCVSEVIVIAAGLSIQDPKERPQDKRQQADQAHAEFSHKESDFLSLFNLWSSFKEQQKALTNNQLRKWCKANFVNYLRMREWQDIVSQLKKAIVDIDYRLNKEPASYIATHTAILSGLLSHLGFKDKDREYLGARSSKFMIFPGSPLSKKSPKWCMVAELVETSKLFGRMAAKIEPEWIEPLASHLVKYQHSEPHWSKKRGSVQGFEKVLLFGLPIVAQRNIEYSRVDQPLCRDLFVREALVNGDSRLNLEFLKHNQQIVSEVELLEEKSRRRDILVDEDDLVTFYDEKIPQHICTDSGLIKWWKNLDSATKATLKFDPNSLQKQQASHVNELNYPQTWQQGNLTLALTYCFEPNQIDDGVSLILPLPLLNQIHEHGFDWLIPGFRHELIVALIKSLPKRLRRNFVPAPNFADACLVDLSDKDKKGKPIGMLEALSIKLFRMTGVEVPIEEWQTDNLPAHLIFNFKVVDLDGKLLLQDRNLMRLKTKLQGKVTETLQQTAKPDVEQKGIVDWTIGNLQKEFVDKSLGYEMKAYPALVPEKQSVAVKLFESKSLADANHKLGLRQLIRLNIPSPVKYLQDKLPNKAKLGLYFNPFGQIQALINDCIDAGIDAEIDSFVAKNTTESAQDIRSQSEFSALREHVTEHINESVLTIAKKVEIGLTTAHGVQKRLKGNVPLNMISAHGDIKQHLSSLVFPGFVAAIGLQKLDDWNRYVKGINRRLEKLAIDPNKDRLHQINLEKVGKLYSASLQKIPEGKERPTALLEVRWMIEELRISFFAQQLGTSAPISVKRIENHLQSF